MSNLTRSRGRFLGIVALCVIGLNSACSQETEQSEQAKSEVALEAARMVYYAIPG
jgi:hypothetical protein